MSETNPHQIQYFESTSMRELVNVMRLWQEKSGKTLIALNIQKEGTIFCCIALSAAKE